MEFELSRSQKEIQKAVTDFARGEFVKEFNENGVFPFGLFQQAAGLGFIGIYLDAVYRLGCEMII
ncbi:MAG: hypothetical protein RBT11_11665 [Desulfobacterales bacterium]|nr:hypothetical protein [Desulfobacterales bacterium]